MKKLAFAMIALAMFPPLLSFAQTKSGEIFGTVVLEDGSAIPGVMVSVTGSQLVGGKSTITNETGRYRCLALPSGEYQLKFELEGFKTEIRRNINVNPGGSFKMDIIMQTGSILNQIFKLY